MDHLNASKNSPMSEFNSFQLLTKKIDEDKNSKTIILDSQLLPHYEPTLTNKELYARFRPDYSDLTYVQAKWPRYVIAQMRALHKKHQGDTLSREERRKKKEEEKVPPQMPPELVHKDAFVEPLPEVSRKDYENQQRRLVKYERDGAQRVPALVKGNAQYTLWKVTPHKSPRIPKPLVYRTGLFRRWVDGEAWYYSQQILEMQTRDPSKKRLYVSGNTVAQMLYYGGGNSKTNELLPKAEIFIADYSDKNSVKSIGVSRLGDFFPPDKRPKTLEIAGQILASEQDLNSFDFGPHKAIRAKICQFFQGVPGIDLLTLQTALDRINARPGGWHILPKLDAQQTAKMAVMQGLTQELQGGVISSDMRLAVKAALEELKDNPPVVVHKVSVDLPKLPAFDELSNLLGQNPYLKHFVDVTALTVGLVTSSSVTNAVAVCVLFINGNPLVRNKAARFLSKLRSLEVVSFQGSKTVFGFIREVFSELVAMVATYVTETVFPSIADLVSPLIGDLCSKMRSATLSEFAKEVAQSVLAAVKTVIDRVIQCVRLGSLAPMWGPDWDPQAWFAEANNMSELYPLLVSGTSFDPTALAELKRLRESGRLSSRWITPVGSAEFRTRVETHIEQGRRIVSSYAGYPIMIAPVRTGIKTLEHLLTTLVLQGVGRAMRTEPLFIYVTGPPGQGKTVMVGEMVQGFLAMIGLSDADKAVYHFQPAVNFQTGLGQDTAVVVMDDVDIVTRPVGPTRTPIEEVIALVNSKPYPVESADVSLKGKENAAPQLVVMVSNKIDADAGKVLDVKAAFSRRISFYLSVTIKPEYATPDGLVDPAKAIGSNTYDMYDIQLSTYKKIPNSEQFLTQPEKVSFPELMVRLRVRYEAHVKRCLELLARAARVGSRCPECFLPTDRNCGHGEATVVVQTATVESGHVATDDEGRDTCQKVVDFIPTVYAKYKEEREKLLIQRKFVACAAAIGMVIPAFFACQSFLTTYKYEGREDNSAPGDQPRDVFKRAPVTYTRLPGFGLGSITKEDLITLSREADFLVHSDSQTTHGKIYGPSIAILVTHALYKKNSTEFLSEVLFQKGELKIRFSIKPGINVVLIPSQPNLCIVKCAQLWAVAGIRRGTMSSVDTQIRQFDEVLVVMQDQLVNGGANKISILHGETGISLNSCTEAGDCGYLYLVRHNNAWKFAAMHFCKLEKIGSSFSFGSLINQIDIDRISGMMGGPVSDFQVIMQSMTTGFNPPETKTYIQKSEVLAAATDYPEAPIQPIGNLFPPIHGMSMKTKVTYGLLRQEGEKLLEILGLPSDYFVLPIFSGAMVGDQWHSPMTNAFSHANLHQWDPELCNLAVYDYLQGILMCDLTGYRELSYDEAILGVSGSSIGSVNMQTSAGPPHMGKKTRYFDPVFEDKNTFSTKEADDLNAEIESALEDNLIPLCVSLQILKDEPLKKGKIPRVFNVLNAIHNIACKRRFAPISMFMRNNLRISECAVGINMTSLESKTVLDILRTIDPTLEKLCAADVEAMDKSWCADLWDQVADVYFAMAVALGLDARKTRLLVLSLRYILHTMKNDMYIYTFNPSGCDITVQLNSIAMSIMDRMLFFKLNPLLRPNVDLAKWRKEFYLDPLPKQQTLSIYRVHNALITYGDDSVKACSSPLPDDYYAQFHEITGFTMTAADKSKGPARLQKLSEIDFLKRKFLFDPFIKQYLPALDLRSLARTLIFKRESVLSNKDHAAVIATEVLREMVYHGREKYDMVLELLRPAIEREGISDNPFLNVRDYDYWYKEVVEGNFSGWEPRTQPNFPEIDGNMVFQAAEHGFPVRSRWLNLYQDIRLVCGERATIFLLICLPSFILGMLVSILRLWYEGDLEALLQCVHPQETRQKIPFGTCESDTLDDCIQTFQSGPVSTHSANWQQQTTNNNEMSIDLKQVKGVDATSPQSLSETNVTGNVSQISGQSMVQSEDHTTPTLYDQHHDIPDDEVMHRMTFLTSTTISSADSYDVGATFFPIELFLANPAVLRRTYNCSFIRGKMEILGVVNAPGSTYGCYVASAIPDCDLSDKTTYGSIAADLVYHNMLQVDAHAMIDVALCNDVKLQLPYVFKYELSPISTSIGPTFARSWQVVLSCLQPVGAGITGGVTTGRISWYGRFLEEDFEMCIVRYQAGPSLLEDFQMSFQGKKHHDVHGQNKDKGKWSSTVRNVSSLAATVATAVPVLAPFSPMIATVGEGVSSIMAAFGFTRSVDERSIMRTVPRSVSNMARVDGEDECDIAALSNTNAISADSRLVGFGPEDPTALASLTPRFTLVAQVNWTQSQTTGTVLAVIPVTPGYCYSETSTLIRPTVAGYCLLPFKFWRGTMIYKIVIPVSKLHRGHLQFTWIPYGSTPTEDVTNVAHNLIYEVTSGQSVELLIGFARESPMLPFRFITTATTIVPVGMTNGFLRITVLNPLSAQSSSANTRISIFSAMEDLQCGVPVDFVDYPTEGHTDPYLIGSQITLQGKALGDEDQETVERFELVERGALLPIEALFTGEVIASTRALMQKFSGVQVLPSGVTNVTMQRLFGPPSEVDTGGDAGYYPWTWASHYSVMFIGVACSERYKLGSIYANTTVGAMRVDNGVTPGLGTMMPFLQSGQSIGEFQIPYYTVKNYVNPRITFPFDGTFVGTLLFCPSAATVPVWFAYGPDIRVAGFRQVPRIRFNVTPLPTNVVYNWSGLG